jgi:flavin reductase (DIM6/NTAB) family NADH-FMN oxidoreductase RutF
MTRHRIEPSDALPEGKLPFEIRDLLLASGDFRAGSYNAMTIGWGSFGVMWNRPFVQVAVRPTRYTYEFMNRFETFTLSAYPAAFKKALALLGSKSGRDGDKIAESGLHPEASLQVAAPSFAEADLVVECRKIYWQDLDPANFLEPGIMGQYPGRDFHRIYFGEIVAASRG